MKTIKGPGFFLHSFWATQLHSIHLESICKWAGSLGFEGVQIPTWDSKMY